MSDITDISVRSEAACFGGTQGFYNHRSETCNGVMNFAVYVPPQAKTERVPVVTYLSGLTCTEENVTIKAGAQRICAELGLLFVAPDTSPRNQEIPGEDESYDLGTGAGFYVDATQDPWSKAYRMYSYITDELPQVIAANFNADLGRQGITGHSMGGHGALTMHLRHPETYHSVSAFSPICNPIESPWGRKTLGAYLGDNKEAWKEHDATELVRRRPSSANILIDQGTSDEFLEENLMPGNFAEACAEVGQALELRMQPGYDHSYYFIQSFMEDHLRHHAAALKG